jgi:Mrp family chromosome partitioning ATPase
VADVVDDANAKNPAAVVEAQRDIIETARGMFDVIVIDTAPLLTTNDAAEILNLADIVLIVARANRTTGEAADRAAELLERRDANAVGAVLVGTQGGRSGRYYYYAQNTYYDEASTTAPANGARSAEDAALFTEDLATTSASPTSGEQTPARDA